MLQRHSKITGQTINAPPTYTIHILLKQQTVMRELYFKETFGVIRQVKAISIPDHTTQVINPYPTAFPYGNGMVLHFYQQQESSTTKTVHKVINKGLKTYV